FGGGNNSICHHCGSGDLANCECGRIHKALPIVDFDSSSGDWLVPITRIVPFVLSSTVETSLISKEISQRFLGPSWAGVFVGMTTECYREPDARADGFRTNSSRANL